MQSQVFKLPYRAPFSVIGDNQIVLRIQYDPNQLWFSFMQGAVIAHETFMEEKTRKSGGPQSPNTPDSLMGILMKRDAQQPLLPLMNFGRLTNSQFKRFKNTIDATWEKNTEGQLHVICVNNEVAFSRQEVVDWCEANLRGRFHFAGRTLTVETTDDAVYCKLRFL